MKKKFAGARTPQDKGLVIGVDIVDTDELDHLHFVQGDITEEPWGGESISCKMDKKRVFFVQKNVQSASTTKRFFSKYKDILRCF